MDRDTLDSLETALEASPDNLQLRFVVVRARLELDEVDAAAELLASVDPSTVTTAADRLTAGTILRRADRADDALSYLDGDDPATRVEKARALHALGRGAEALREHAAAVADDPSVEDGVLAAELSRSGAAEEEGTESEQRGPLRLVSSGPEHVDDSLDTLLRPQHQPVTFDDIGGLEQVKKQVRKKILLPFQKPSIFARFRKRVGGGILMYGPPGCGKTLLARATAGECSARFLSVAISDILDMYIGESERKLHALFETARQETPSVLFFDEVEALGARRQSTRDSTSAKLVSQFLAEMDGFTQDNHGVLVLAATNVPWSVDGAFLRPGRFDRTLFVPPPDREAREVILDIHLRERPHEDGLDLKDLSRRTKGFSGADLEALVEEAADLAIEDTLEKGEEVPMTTRHLKEALGELRPTTLDWLSTARNHARYADEGGRYREVLDFLDRFGK